MNKIVSEDAVRRAFAGVDEDEGAVGWDGTRSSHVAALAEPWILDIDTTVKPLYGHQEGAVVGYNPRSQGGRAIAIIPTRWLAHGWYSMSMSLPATSTHRNIRARPAGVLDRIPRDLWPALSRGDCVGNEPIM